LEYPLFDVVTMQFVMHYAFESEEKARTMLLNVSKNLRRGGYFIGTIPSSDAIIEGIKSLPEDSKEFGNSIYTVRFPERPTQTVFRPPYGHRYNFFMEDAVGNVPEYIVPFEVFRG
jgi:mRNA (guanine-N7-)-methyltransferase